MSCLTLARVLSQSRAGKLRDTAAKAPHSLDDVRAKIQRTRVPAEWTAVVSLTRWLSDVPRSHATDEVLATPAPKDAVRAPKDAARSHPSGVFEPASALREWIALGKGLGQAAMHHYIGRLRAIVRRSPD